jgi:hypothetical protein
MPYIRFRVDKMPLIKIEALTTPHLDFSHVPQIRESSVIIILKMSMLRFLQTVSAADNCIVHHQTMMALFWA